MASGAELTFEATDSEDIYYNTVSAEAAFPGDWTKYSAQAKPTVTEDVTYYVKGTASGLGDSEVAAFSYTVLEKSTVAEARAASKEVWTEGVITFTDGRNAVIQDETGGINVDFGAAGAAATAGAALGKTLTVVGTRGNYSGLQQVAGLSVYTLSPDTTLLPMAVPKTIAEIKAGATPTLESTRVRLEDVVLGAVNPGGNTAVTSGGDTINIYKIPALPETIYETCTVDIDAVVGYNNNAWQLRVAKADDVTLVSAPTTLSPVVPGTANGATVESGGKLTFTCLTPNAILKYNTTSAEHTEWTEVPTGGITVPEMSQGSTYTVYVKASKEGFADTAVLTLSYTVGAVAPVPLSQVRAMADNSPVFVSGVITWVNGQSITIQDETGGGVIRLSSAYSGGAPLALGQTVTATGKTAQYNNLLQINTSNSDFVITDATAGPLPDPVVIRVSDFGNATKMEALESMRVIIRGLQVTLIDGKNTTLSNTDGSTVVYQLPGGKLQLNDWANVVGVVQDYKGSYTIRVPNAEHITKLSGPPIPVMTCDLAEWNYSAAHITPVPATAGEHMDGAEATLRSGNFTYSASGGVSAAGWKDAANYVQFKLSTLGFEDLTLTGSVRSSGAGPRDLKVSYSTDGVSFADVPGGAFSVDTASTNLSKRLDGLALPAALSDKASVYIRIVRTSDARQDGKDGDISGNFGFNGLVFRGNEIPNDLLVEASLPAGEIAAGATLTLSNRTEGSVIQYRIYTDPTAKGEFAPYTPGAQLALDTLPCFLEAKASHNGQDSRIRTYSYTQLQVQPVKANIMGGGILPGTILRLSCTTKDAVISYDMTTKAGLDGEQTSLGLLYDGEAGIPMTEEMFPVKLVLHGDKAGWASYTGSAMTFTMKVAGEEKLYFGQLHSHTGEYSDGSGTLAEALDYAKNTARSIDFVAFTDHSNYFDSASKLGDITDESKGLASKVDPSKSMWQVYKETITAVNDDTFIGVPGYEMTWSGGPGHINTFNTTGIVSRHNSTLNNKTNDAGMQAYYELLAQNPQTISQFNHPGTTFGTFADFGYYRADYDAVISLLEVGNGEGAVTSSGYFPSYQYYTMALDKGWHVAPTNNQDNHKGRWGDSNTTRTVILTDDFSLDGLYQAMRDMRVYSTEDENLEILYTLNSMPMGSILAERPDRVDIKVVLNDQDGEKLGDVSIITQGGRTVSTEYFGESSATWELTLTGEDAAYPYYFIRVNQPDKDIAVTAPVWTSSVKRIGITDLTTDAVMEVKDQAQDLTTSLYNFERSPLNLTEIKYELTRLGTTSTLLTLDAAALAGLGLATIAPETSTAHVYPFTPTQLGFQTVTVTVTATQYDELTEADVNYTFTKNLELEVLDASELIPIAIDGGHSNFYVTGNYNDSDAGLIEMCARSNILAKRLGKGELTYENIKDMALVVLTVPFKSFGTAVTDCLYTPDELDALAQYAAAGGNFMITSKSDRGDPSAANEKAAVITNGILEAVGANARVAKGIVIDDVRKANELYRITLGGDSAADQLCFNYGAMATDPLADIFLKDVQETTNNTFSAYNSAPILANGATVLVQGFPETTWGTLFAELKSNTELGESHTTVTDKGATNLITAERLPGGGFAIVSGVTFFSTFEVKVELDYAGQKQNTNYQIVQNILDQVKPAPVITDIADVHAAEEGVKFTVQGIATSNASGYDKQTAFFDCIYVEDESGGINVFPVDADIQEGQLVRITGYTSSYQGERQLQASTVKVVDPAVAPVEPLAVTAAEAMSAGNIGRLMKLKGTVHDITLANGVVQVIIVKDAAGALARVFIDGYITPDYDMSPIKVGGSVEVVGLGSYDVPLENTPGYENLAGHRLRISDRAKITLLGSSGGGGSGGGGGSVSNIVRPGDVKENAASVDVKLPASGAKLNDAATEKVIAANETKPVMISGVGVNVTIPAGTLAKGSDVNAMVVNPKDKGNVIQVTRPDGTTVILPFSAIGNGSAAYLANVVGTYKIIDNTKDFPDVKSDHWAADAINFVSAHEFFKGMEDGLFRPELPMTRAMLVTVLARIDGGKAAEGSPFIDVPDSAWYAKEVTWAAQNKLVEGDGTAFNPNDTITREQLCVILARYLTYSGFTLNETNEVGRFADLGEVSPWAADAVNLAIKTGLIGGKESGLLDPQGPATRAEIATILQRFVEAVVK